MITSAVSVLEEKNSKAIPLLTPFVTDEDWRIRFCHRLARALGSLGGK